MPSSCPPHALLLFSCFPRSAPPFIAIILVLLVSHSFLLHWFGSCGFSSFLHLLSSLPIIFNRSLFWSSSPSPSVKTPSRLLPLSALCPDASPSLDLLYTFAFTACI